MSQNQGDYMSWPSRDMQNSSGPVLQEENHQRGPKETHPGQDEEGLLRGGGGSCSEMALPTYVTPPLATSQAPSNRGVAEKDDTRLQCSEEVPLSPGQLNKSRVETGHEEDTIMLDSGSPMPDAFRQKLNTSVGVSEELNNAGGCPRDDGGWAELSRTQNQNEREDKVIDLSTRLPDHSTSPHKEEISKDLGTSIMSGGNQVDIKRDITFWVNRGLPNEGIELNEMKLLNKLTPNYVLKEYFTKVQARLYPEAMPSRFRKDLEELYEKVYDRPLAADSNISVKFARAFLAQEKKGNVKFNWAGFAVREYIRTTDRAALKSRKSTSSQHGEEQDQGDQDDDEAQPNAQVPPPVITFTDRVSLQSAADEHLKSLRADLQTTHRWKDSSSLREFDGLVSSFMSGKYLLERAQADIRREKERVALSVSSAQRQCLLLKQAIQEVQGKVEFLGALVQKAVNELLDVKARKPVAFDDPNFDFFTWKSWCTEMQQHCAKLGYFQVELREQECALKKLLSDEEAVMSQQKEDSQKLDLLTERAARCMDHTSYHVDDISGDTRKRKTPPF